MSSGSIEGSVRADHARIPSERVRLVNAPVLLATDENGEGGMTVTPVVQGSTIRVIEVRCACGRSLSLECEYEPSEDAAEGDVP